MFVVAWNDGALDLEQWCSKVGNQEQMKQEDTPAGAVQMVWSEYYMAVAEDYVVQVVSVVPYGVRSGAEFVVGVEAQVFAADLAQDGKMGEVGLAVDGPDHQLGEMVDGAVNVVEELVVPELAGSPEYQADADTEAGKP